MHPDGRLATANGRPLTNPSVTDILGYLSQSVRRWVHIDNGLQDKTVVVVGRGSGMAITNGAVDYLTRSLAVELAPIRVNTISPGVIDTGAWDSLGEAGKHDYFEHIGSSNPARRIGTPEDVADAVLFAMTNTFLTGVTLKIDGGEPLT
jgi:enoyl-[acyl-carrier-protein] reductase (NADH)